MLFQKTAANLKNPNNAEYMQQGPCTNGEMMPLTGFSVMVTFKADNYTNKKKENSAKANTSLSQE